MSIRGNRTKNKPKRLVHSKKRITATYSTHLPDGNKILKTLQFEGSDEKSLKSMSNSDIKTTESANSDLLSIDQYPQKSYSSSSDDSSSENEKMMSYRKWSNLSVVKMWLNTVILEFYGNSWYFHPSPPSDDFDGTIPKELVLKYAKQLIREQEDKYGVKKFKRKSKKKSKRRNTSIKLLQYIEKLISTNTEKSWNCLVKLIHPLIICGHKNC